MRLQEYINESKGKNILTKIESAISAVDKALKQTDSQKEKIGLLELKKSLLKLIKKM